LFFEEVAVMPVKEFVVTFPFLKGLQRFAEEGGYWDGNQLSIRVQADNDKSAIGVAIKEVAKMKENDCHDVCLVGPVSLVIPRTVKVKCKSDGKGKDYASLKYFGLLNGPMLTIVRAKSLKQALRVWRTELGMHYEPDGSAEVLIKYQGPRLIPNPRPLLVPKRRRGPETAVLPFL